MNSQNKDDDSIDFSVIEKNSEQQGCGDFSVRSLLGQEEEPQFTKPSSAVLNLHKSVEDVFSKMRNLKVGTNRSILKQDHNSIPQQGQQFLKDLSKMQKELSFESTIYNVYQQNQNVSSQLVHPNKSKTYSCLKLTKQQTIKSTNKSTSKEETFNFNEYYGPLIIDFKKEQGKNHVGLKSRQKSKQIKNNDSKNSNFSSDYSEESSRRQKKMTKSKSKDHLDQLFGRDKSKSSRNHLGVYDFRKSKSKSHHNKLGSASKSQSNLKISTQTQNYSSSKVFTQYYGTQIQVTNKKSPEMKKPTKLTKVKSRQKSSSLKHKLSLLSPRAKQSVKTTHKK